MAKSAIARALDKLFEEVKPDGSPRFTIVDIHAARAMILLEIARRQELHTLDQARKEELAYTLDLIGIKPTTDPALMMGLIERYFKRLELNPDLFPEMARIFKMFDKKGDRVEAVVAAEKAYDKMTEKEAQQAPAVGEKPPEGSERAQTLTLNLGGKVRI
jgi:hypothetical protein